MSKRSEKKELEATLRTLVWVPLLLGGVAAALVAARGPLGRALRKLLAAKGDEEAGQPSDSATDSSPGPQAAAAQVAPRRKRARSLALLRQAIIGNDKHAVVAVFGPPPTTGGYTTPPDPALKLPDYFRADTWYYLLDKVNRRALAIQFESGVAAEAQFLEAPHHVR